MTRLTSDTMRELGGKVFGERSTTLTEAASAYEMDDLTGTIAGLRKLMRSTLESLPEAAFDAQPAGEGEAAWSAGQVVAHIANSQASMSGAIHRLLDLEPASNPAAASDLETLPGQEDALNIFSSTESAFDTFVAAIPTDADLSRTMTHERFGEMSAKGWLLLMALHEADHLQQVKSLAK